MLMATSLNIFEDLRPDMPGYMRRIAAAGIEGLDYNGIDVIRDWVKVDGARWAAEMAEAAQGAGLVFVQSHGPMFSGYDDQCATHEALVRPCLEYSARLGVPWMVMHPFTLPAPATWQDNFRANLAFYRAYLPACEATGVGLALENMSDFFSKGRRYCATPDELANLCDALDHPLVGLCWDTGHAHLQQVPQEWAIGQLGSRLKVLHIQDNNARNDDHILPLHGSIDWSTVLAGLKAAGYTGAWSLETHNGIRRLPDHLRDEALALGVKISRWITRDYDVPASA